MNINRRSFVICLIGIVAIFANACNMLPKEKSSLQLTALSEFSLAKVQVFPKSEYFSLLAMGSQGFFYTLKNTSSELIKIAENMSFELSKYDDNNTLLWSKSLSKLLDLQTPPLAQKLYVTPENEPIIILETGNGLQARSSNAHLLKLDSKGELLFHQVLHSDSDSQYLDSSYAQGSLYVLGYSYLEGESHPNLDDLEMPLDLADLKKSTRSWVLQLDENLKILKQIELESIYPSDAKITSGSGEKFYIAGMFQSSSEDISIEQAIVCYDQAGEEIWRKDFWRSGIPSPDTNQWLPVYNLPYELDLIADRGDNLWVLQAGEQEINIQKLLSNGDLEWSKPITSSASTIKNLALGADQSLYLCGWTSDKKFPLKNAHQETISMDRNSWAMIWSKTGEMLYSSYLGGKSSSTPLIPYDLDSATSIYPTPEGFAVAGFTVSNSEFPVGYPIEKADNDIVQDPLKPYVSRYLLEFELIEAK